MALRQGATVMAFAPKKPYPLGKARPPNSPEPGDKPNHKRTFDMRPKPAATEQYRWSGGAAPESAAKRAEAQTPVLDDPEKG